MPGAGCRQFFKLFFSACSALARPVAHDCPALPRLIDELFEQSGRASGLLAAKSKSGLRDHQGPTRSSRHACELQTRGRRLSVAGLAADSEYLRFSLEGPPPKCTFKGAVIRLGDTLVNLMRRLS